MASLAVQIADAVVAALNGADLGVAFTAQRAYLPTFDLADMDGLKVTVVPVELGGELASRTSTTDDVAVQVGIQKRVNPENLGEIDALMSLAQAIGDYFRFRRLDTTPPAAWAATELDPLFVPEHLEQMRQFTAVVTLLFRMTRS